MAAQSSNYSLDGRDKLFGKIDSRFKCDRFTELDTNLEMFSKQILSIRGLTWQLVVKKEPFFDSLGIYVKCEMDGHGQDTNPENNNGWSCHASVSICLHSQRPNGNIVKNSSHNFRPDKSEHGFNYILNAETILDPKNHWLDEQRCFRISAEINTEEPEGVNYVVRPNVVFLNEEEIRVNKYHLACQSKYFESFFFGKDYKKNDTILVEWPATVDHFKRMLDTMEPENRPLDDQFIEGVYHLANQFLLNDVEGKCRDYLFSWSERSVIFKYRLAEKYGFEMMKGQILTDFQAEDFIRGADYFENLREYAQLGEKARNTLDIRLGQLFGQNIFGEETVVYEPPSKRARRTD